MDRWIDSKKGRKESKKEEKEKKKGKEGGREEEKEKKEKDVDEWINRWMDGWIDRWLSDRQTLSIYKKHYSGKKSTSSDTNPYNQSGVYWDHALCIFTATTSGVQYGAQWMAL